MANSQQSGGYYLPEPSSWPIKGSIALFLMASGFIWFLSGTKTGLWVVLAGFAFLTYMMVGWFGQVAGESESGKYNKQVDISYRWSMSWFIFSEVMFFAAFFGALYYARAMSVPWLGDIDNKLLWPNYTPTWPTAGPYDAGAFKTIGAWGVPFWNTVILLTSGLTVTLAHWALKKNNRSQLIFWLAATVALGCLFLFFQAEEYIHAYKELGLTLGKGIYGATFFMLTGFHGFHVTIGTIMLIVILFRCIKGHFKPHNHFAFEAVSWYWHFVDVVWIGLFIFVYAIVG